MNTYVVMNEQGIVTVTTSAAEAATAAKRNRAYVQEWNASVGELTRSWSEDNVEALWDVVRGDD